jgi:hypothetical protein
MFFNGGGVANSAPVNTIVTNLPAVLGSIGFASGGQQLTIS